MQLIPSLITQASFTPGARDVQVTPGMSVFRRCRAGVRTKAAFRWMASTRAHPSTAAGVSGYIADVTNAQEVAFTTSGGLGEAEVGGPTMSIVPKTGGNSIKGSALPGGSCGLDGRQQLHA